ncbi:4-hydroxy-tetrahydrodipicolinate reductase [Sporanaerobacter acetigenes]|uniref:4-hydroxy-tetrahydrodipicolinate reductase n=1 Tax=Sporanaerobacter acetigenes DSM 13106 TaxID=1123281 RepID=A0A1M5WUN2_9FIRM|nr:4-hydroxy-tetrahydrodipicolinate reductase [Sporanaerobacter acetigenes]SHH90814.1 dihydrodipicolinate reductase [Sporanaerobacter acetigenes DSM 13106]
MINVLINGFYGKMGQVLANEVKQDNDMNLIAGVDKNAISTHSDSKVYNYISDCNDAIDVIIDFSHPDSLSDLLKYATEKNIALVIGTTGLTSNDMDKIKMAAEKIPIFYSANMSLGINVLVSILKNITPVLEDTFDMEIVEKHHNKKIDAPSGTAYMLAEAINSTLEDKKDYVFDRHVKKEARDKNEIGIHSIRGGTIVGEHTVIFAGCDEVIEIKHSASSKKIFAQGAIKAAKFIYNKESGFYNMEDLMKM